MTEHELVEIGGGVCPADALVGPVQPRFQVADGLMEMRDRVHEVLARALDDALVDIAGLGQRLIGGPAVGDNGRAGLDDLLDEADERRGGVVGHESDPESPRVAAADFEGHHDECGTAPDPGAALALGLLPADPRLVHLDGAAQLPAVEIDRGPAQLVEHHPRRLVAGDAELPLEPERRDAALVGDHQERRPEPDHERRPGPVEEGPCRDRHLVVAPGTDTVAALPAGPRNIVAAARASESVRPAALGEVVRTRLLGREAALELDERLGESRTAGRHAPTLPVVATGGNRIAPSVRLTLAGGTPIFDQPGCAALLPQKCACGAEPIRDVLIFNLFRSDYTEFARAPGVK